MDPAQAEPTQPPERHFITRIGWLRAAVLGANDGIVSTASLITGVAAAGMAQDKILMTGIAGMAAGAMSMAVGEYVSVSSQADSEKADIEREKQELATMPEQEHQELADIYVDRGLEPGLAHKVADQLMAKDALKAHARDELGISEIVQAKPVQAALSSGAAFTVGATLPVAAIIFSPAPMIANITTIVSLVTLAGLGGISAYTGGAHVAKAILRVTLGGAFAMAGTAGIGFLFGTTIS